jgi:hypothetical protein
MGELRSHPPVLLVVAAFSRHDAALLWARGKLQELYGPIALASELFPFQQTSYYESEMGPALRKQFLAFRDLIAPERLAPIKLQTNRLEAALAEARLYSEARPLNLDPGVLELGKFVLATTKDQAHRIYLSAGIFAEVTLRFQEGAFEPWPWTYADYRQAEVRAFLKEARGFYKLHLKTPN